VTRAGQKRGLSPTASRGRDHTAHCRELGFSNPSRACRLRVDVRTLLGDAG
jgi:hypothetical protein